MTLASLPAIVLDTNTLVSATIFPESIPANALRKARRDFRLLASVETMLELAEVFQREKFDRYIARADRLAALRFFEREFLAVPNPPQVRACRDPRDDKFLSLAVAGNAQILVTGDLDLLALHPYGSLTIVRPADFLFL